MKNQMLSELVRQGDETACLGIVPNPQRAVANRRLGTYACIANRLVAEPPRLKRSDINQLEPWTSRITKRRAIWRDVLHSPVIPNITSVKRPDRKSVVQGKSVELGG